MAPEKLKSLPALDHGVLNVIVETSKGQRSKFKYDPKRGIFQLEKRLPLGLVFPFDFGFVPSTIGEDGDPLDALILGEEPTIPGTLVLCQLTAVLEAEQSEKEETKRNDRFIVTPLDAKSRKPLEPAIQFDKSLMDAVAEFFVVYNKLQGKAFHKLGIRGTKRAHELMEQGIARAQGRHKRVSAAHHREKLDSPNQIAK